ncbi:MAG: 50S ribosomal protein L5 [Nanoarchaeota archaeon]|nr:50S ribosomal protein L5 [Nanoarchaeota archaeon]
MEQEKNTKKDNLMREIFMEKLVISCGGIKDDLNKGIKLLEKVSGKKAARMKTVKRIPGFGIRPTMEVGGMVTLRGEEATELLVRLLAAIENEISKKQIADNHFSFGIKEYIEIPGEKYDRDIGMRGFKVTLVFARKGKRVVRKKIKKGKLGKRQVVKKEEIIKFMEDSFQTDIY